MTISSASLVSGEPRSDRWRPEDRTRTPDAAEPGKLVESLDALVADLVFGGVLISKFGFSPSAWSGTRRDRSFLVAEIPFSFGFSCGASRWRGPLAVFGGTKESLSELLSFTSIEIALDLCRLRGTRMASSSDDTSSTFMFRDGMGHGLEASDSFRLSSFAFSSLTCSQPRNVSLDVPEGVNGNRLTLISSYLHIREFARSWNHDGRATICRGR